MGELPAFTWRGVECPKGSIVSLGGTSHFLAAGIECAAKRAEMLHRLRLLVGEEQVERAIAWTRTTIHPNSEMEEVARRWLEEGRRVDEAGEWSPSQASSGVDLGPPPARRGGGR